MSSYLTYCLAYTQKLTSILYEPRNNEITMYEYFPMLWKNRALENYRRTYDVFLGKLCLELAGTPRMRISQEAQSFVQSYDHFYIQFLRFTYIRIGGFEKPMKLPRHALDYFVLAGVCIQLAFVVSKYILEEK